jgi:hypothetical protein
MMLLADVMTYKVSGLKLLVYEALSYQCIAVDRRHMMLLADVMPYKGEVLVYEALMG